MTQGNDEQELLTRLRGGQDEAFGELFELHAPAVRRFAGNLASDASEAEDITAESFFRVLRAIKRGNGPTDNVRGYLLTVARRVAGEWKGGQQDVPVSDDELTSRAGATEHAVSRSAEYTLITRAFTSLPERWRTVLWRTEVEGAQPATVASHFGLSPNATAALARRARQGLRAAYLQAHLGSHRGNAGCRSVLDKLGSYTAGAVTPAEAARIAAHLGACSGCRSTHDELRDVCYSLRANSAAIMLAAPAIAATASGKLTAVKSVFTGAKLKIGAAVASTAVVGVLGLSAGPVIHESAVDVLGLQGQQGNSHVDPTIQRAAGEDETSVDGTTIKRSESDSQETRWSTPEREAQRTNRDETSSVNTQAADELAGAAHTEVPLQRDASIDTRNPLSDAPPPSPGDAAPNVSKSKELNDIRSSESAQQETGEPTNKPALAPEGPPATSYEDVAHDCVDDHEYYEKYNQAKGRTETYEYSYLDGQGRMTTTYRYDDGETTSYTYTWQDEC